MKFNINRERVSSILKGRAKDGLLVVVGGVLAVGIAAYAYQGRIENANTESKPSITLQPSQSPVSTLPAAQTPRPAAPATSSSATKPTGSQSNSAELAKAVAVANELKRCIAIEKPAATTFSTTRDNLFSTEQSRTHNVFTDSRLNSSQAKAIEGYNRRIYNTGAAAAYKEYINVVSGQGCTPTAVEAAYFPIPNDYPDLMTNYPYLASYPNVVFN